MEPSTTRPDGLLSLAVVSVNAIIGAGLSQLLATAPGVKVTDLADSIVALHRTDPPDLVVLDLHEHRTSRLGADFWSAMPAGARGVVLCRSDDPPDLALAVRAGVRAVLTRETAPGELLGAVETARQGGLHVTAELVPPFLEQVVGSPPVRGPQLAVREVETLRWVAQGLTHRQISRRMGLTEATVNTYVKRIRAKLNAGNKAELTRRAVDLGYVAPS
ncbi:response regulator transcription factor [Actinoplanes sp. NPDC049596]|uniref:response regulator transcription factor n=1 Tax=unclassified Actinoplanes TaxID=2626549 RepID=UPI0034496781